MTILVAGDFCPQNHVAELFENGSYESVLGKVKPIIERTDYSIVNFECPVTKGGEKPIEKCGPNLQCSEKGVEAMKWAGFNCITLANNHFYDYGKEGVEQTIETCNKYGIETVGGGKNLHEASKILYKKINGKMLAIINCCEHEFSIATEKTAGSNPLNPVKQYYAIKEAKEQADYVLVIVHGGHELWQLPSPRMVETYRFFIDAGADAVVNHHQHCYSGYEIYQDKPIFYGIGNFCFDKNKKMNDIWYYGYLVTLFFDEKIDFEIIPYKQCKENPTISLMEVMSFNNKLKELNNIIADITQLQNKTNSYYKLSSKYYCDIFEPIENRFYIALKRKGMLPSFITRSRMIKAENKICCESHFEKLVFCFKTLFSD